MGSAVGPPPSAFAALTPSAPLAGVVSAEGLPPLPACAAPLQPSIGGPVDGRIGGAALARWSPLTSERVELGGGQDGGLGVAEPGGGQDGGFGAADLRPPRESGAHLAFELLLP